MQLQARKQNKFKQLSKIAIFNPVKEGDSVRQERDNQKIEDQKSEAFEDVEPLIQKSQKFWKLSKNCVIKLVILILIIGVVITFIFGFFNKNNEDPNLSDQFYDPTQRSDLYDLVVLNSSSALCLDGSPGTYYISRGGNPNKVYIHFEAGGWCGDVNYDKTLQTCYYRSKTGIGSSKFNPPQMQRRSGIFSQQDKNYFKDWKKVFFSYCDGAGHQGTKKDPIKYNDTLLYFRGHNLTIERLQSLDEKIGLFSKAKRIVVSGQSAGGPASLYWSNYVAERARNAKVYAFPSSGIFYDSINQTKNYDFRQVFITILNITNQQIDHPLSECVKQNPKDKYKCMFVQYMYKYVKVPMFFLQSLYDSFSIPVIIGIKCDENFAYGWPIIKNCGEDKMQTVRQYRKEVYDLLKDIARDEKNGIWAVDCTGHGYMNGNKFYSQYFEVPQHSGNQISKSFENWIQNRPGPHVFIDEVQWPNNQPCSGDAF